MTNILSVRNLSLDFHGSGPPETLLDNINLDLAQSEILGLVGESGSGKSLLCRTIIGLIPSPNLKPSAGEIRLDGEQILGLPERDMVAIRGRKIGMIFQNPTSHLDPVMRIGDQICEGILKHQSCTRAEARIKAIDLLDQVGFPDPARGFRSFAHEFSGGMRQRAMIAIALACEPEILIADEPTTALDVTVQAQILNLLVELRAKRGLSIILITHDLGVVAQTCDRIAVMRAGQIVETGEKRALLSAPKHPYTRQLIASHPSIDETTGDAGKPDEVDADAAPRPIFEIDDLEVVYGAHGGFFKRTKPFKALDDVSLRIFPGESVGIVGESGSGKSTMARAIMGLTPISAGHVTYDGSVLTLDRAATLARIRHEVAMVFQDPYNALNPRLDVESTLREVLKTQGEVPPERIPARINELMDLVGLEKSLLKRKPKSLSGGQCQRVGIARALAVNPKVIIADECVAALDVTIQAQIIDLLKHLAETIGLTIVFIAHDLAIVRQLCERIVVMHDGKIVEMGKTSEVFSTPTQTYTADLLSAIPNIDPDKPLLSGATSPAS